NPKQTPAGADGTGTKRGNNAWQSSRFFTLCVLTLVVASLYFAHEVLIPVVLSALVAFVLAPIANWLEHYRVPRAIAAVICVVVALGAVGVLGWIVARQIIGLADSLPVYCQEITRKVET